MRLLDIVSSWDQALEYDVVENGGNQAGAHPQEQSDRGG